VETPEALVYHTHLCGRPLPGTRRSPLGRETAIQKCVWRDDDWLYLEQGGVVPAWRWPRPIQPRSAPRVGLAQRLLEGRELPMEFQWLRTPTRAALLAHREGAAPARRESIGSWFEQSLVARRQEDFRFRARPRSRSRPRLPAGRRASPTTTTASSSTSSRSRGTRSSGARSRSCPAPATIPTGACVSSRVAHRAARVGAVGLAVEVHGAETQFFYDTGEGWRRIGPALDASVISDEGGRGAHGSFTGASSA
jgi:xylan 1,4-beta-xylosidase